MKSKSPYPIDSLFKGLRTLLASLPSEEEKDELIQTLRETRDFLEELHILIETIPTMESSASLSQGLSRLDILADRAVNDAPLRRLMGLRGSQGNRGRVVNGAEDAKSRADNLARSLKDSESSDLVSLLERSGEPISVLAEMATSLGLRTRSKERKADLIRRIATHVTNQRGYKLLRGGDPPGVDDGAIPTTPVESLTDHFTLPAPL